MSQVSMQFSASVGDWSQSPYKWIDLDDVGEEDLMQMEPTVSTWRAEGSSWRDTCRRCCKARLFRMERILYLLERNMSKYGTLLQVVALLFLGALLVLLGGLVYSLVWEANPDNEDEHMGPVLESFWEAWTFIADGGTHAAVMPGQRVPGAVISVVGIAYLGVVMAVIVDVVRERIDNMRRGRTKVYERNHTFVVNWTDKTVPVIAEICNANKSEGGGVVVVLANESMEMMSMELQLQLPESQRFGTRVVCRTGSPVVVADLCRVSADRAKAILILACGTNADEADSSTLRCVLSLKSIGKLQGHIVAELRDIDNEPVLKLVGGKAVESLVSHDVLGRLMLMAVRQPGLAKVYEAVLGFDGDEFYMREWPHLVGQTFGSLLERFPNAIPVGIHTASGQPLLNPPPELKIELHDKVIVIAEDDDTYKAEEAVDVDAGRAPSLAPSEPITEKVLICGWRRDIRDILTLLNSLLKTGSEVHTVTHCVPAEQRNQQLLDEGLDVNTLENITLLHHFGNTSSRKRLEALPLEIYTWCVIFADQAFEADAMHADSHTLASLLLIRDIQACRVRDAALKGAPVSTQHPTPISCEVLDSRTVRTISAHKNLRKTSDFVQSNKLIAQILAMVSESRSVKVILDELLGQGRQGQPEQKGGSTLLVVPPHWFVGAGEEASFWTLAKRAAATNAILIGYQVRGSIEKTVLNPPNKWELRTWDAMDLAIIAASWGDHGSLSTASRKLSALERDSV